MDNRKSGEVSVKELQKFWDEIRDNPSYESYVTLKALISSWIEEIKRGNFSITKDKDDKSFERIDKFICNYSKYDDVLTNLYQKLSPTDQALANSRVDNLIEEARKGLKKR